MLEKLLIENFQIYERRLFEFDPLVNCFWGPTDCGKSAAIRALLWVATNQPRGDTFIRRGCTWTRVTLWVDGHKIKRERGKGVNSYQLDDGAPFEAFGSAVPEEIAKVLNISPVSIQRQLDPVFYFSLSPGEVSRELNQIVNLELIDKTLANLAQEQRRAKTNLEVSQERLAQARERKQELAWIKACDKALVKLEDLENKVDEWHQELNGLETLLGDIKDLDQQLENYQQKTKQQERLVELGIKVQEVQEEVVALDELLEVLDNNQGEITRAQQAIETKEQELQQETEGCCPLCGQEVEVWDD